MNKRTKTGQKKHDESVLRSAGWYKKHGFRTNADLPGWNKPKKIGGFIPDLIAKKANILCYESNFLSINIMLL
ncbi:hypothetical protein KKB17_00505 [bacterium]|nr:hypothetical protein [bacterium]